MGVQADEITQARLIAMLADSDPQVQRVACESLVRAGLPMAPDKLIKLLGSEDRYVAWAARRAIEQLPVSAWRDTVLKSTDTRVFLQGGLALMVRQRL